MIDNSLIRATCIVTKALCLGLHIKVNSRTYGLTEDGEIVCVAKNETTGEPAYLRVFADYARLGALDIARQLTEDEIVELGANCVLNELNRKDKK